MSWMPFVWVVTALLAVCRGLNLVGEENGSPISGYHLCVRNETRTVSVMVTHKISYTTTRPCGWLLWTQCEVRLYKLSQRTEYKTITEQVTRCCDGYEQVGRYCALPVNRSEEFTAKPGSCPRDGACPSNYERCDWDIDCPGWQKCCQRIGVSLCQNPSSSSNYSEIGRCRFNVTVTVKIDYNQLMSKDQGLLNHTRILQAMVTGGLQSDASVFYLDSWPVHPFRTATSLLIVLNCTLSLHTVTSKLHLLLKHIQEVSAVHVEDVDECTHSALHHCPPQAECNNTLGSYHCICRQGFTDDDPSNAGAQCAADVSNTSTTTTELPASMNTIYTPASNAQPDLTGNLTTATFSFSETSISHTSAVLYDSSHSSTNATPYTSMNLTVVSPLPATTCFPPRITRLQSTNVTGTSFCVYWSSHFQANQTYVIVLHQQSELINRSEISQTMMEVTGLQPGLLYKVTVTPHACGSQGPALDVWIKTDAQTLNATAQFTNIEYTSDLKNTSSQAYRNLTESIVKEIYQFLPPDIKALMDSGQVRLVIVGFSPGSVMANFAIISAETDSKNISSVATAVLHSLKNSSKYTVDENNTSIMDFDECAKGDNDCSKWANCSNTWGSYTCRCLKGFIENNSERPGRACEAVVTTKSEAKTTAGSTAPYSEINSTGGPTVTSTVSTLHIATVTSEVVPAVVTSLPATPLLTSSTVTHTVTAVPAVTVSHTTPTSDGTTTATPMVNTTSALASTNTSMTTTAPTTTAIIPTPTTNSTTMTTITSSPISTVMTAGADTNAMSTTTSVPTTNTSVLSTTSSSPMVTTNVKSTTTSEPTTNTSVLSTTSSSPMTATNAISTTTSAPTTNTSALPTTSSSPMVTTNVKSTTTSEPTTSTSVLPTTSSSPVVITNAMSTTTSAPTTNTSVLPTTSSSPMVTTNVKSTTTSEPTTSTSVLSTTSSSPVMTTNAMSTTTSAPTTNTSVGTGIAAATTTTTSASTTTSPVLSTTTSAPSITSMGTRSTTSAPAPISSALTTSVSITTNSIAITSSTFMTATSSAMTSAITNPATTSTTTAVSNTTAKDSVKGDITVECRAAAITVTVAKDFLQRSQIRETDLYLGLKECVVNGGNDTHVQLTVAWDECNTILVKNETYYTVSVILLNNMDPYTSANGTMIVPKVRLQMPIICAYSKKALLSTDFGSMGYDLIKDIIMASGSFQVIVQLMNGTVPLPHNYSLSSDEAVVVQVSLNTSTEQIKVIMNKCWATPTQNPADSKSYTFLDNSCSLNSYTQVLTNGNSSISRVSVQIFSFVSVDMIYLHCLVQICVETGSTTCIPDCLQRSVQTRTTIGRNVATTGPLLRMFEETLEEKLDLIHIVGFSCLGVGLALLFIFGFVCILYWQRNRVGHYNFNAKPKQENFAHIALDT